MADGTIRLTIDLGEPAQAALESCLAREPLNASTLLNRAIQVYDLVLGQADAGGEILVRRRRWWGGATYERLRIQRLDADGVVWK